jgi:aminobenzoyl-glutamate utilization protein B
VHNALGGIPATIDPTIQAAAKAIGATLIDLLTNAGLLAAARAEFVERTGGGIGGERWQAPIAPGRFQGASSIAMARVRDHRARRGMVHSVAGR